MKDGNLAADSESETIVESGDQRLDTGDWRFEI